MSARKVRVVKRAPPDGTLSVTVLRLVEENRALVGLRVPDRFTLWLTPTQARRIGKELQDEADALEPPTVFPSSKLRPDGAESRLP